jgi:hypothetical protein
MIHVKHKAFILIECGFNVAPFRVQSAQIVVLFYAQLCEQAFGFAFKATESVGWDAELFW